MVMILVTVAIATGAKYHGFVERWKNPDYEHRRYQKVIVLGITGDSDVRRTFEDLFVTHLRGRQIECVTSYSLVPDLANVDEAERRVIVDAIEGQGFDGAISVRAVPLAGTTEEQWADEWSRQIESDRPLRELIEASLPLDAVKSKRYGLEVTLWSVAGGGRVWSARTDPYKLEQLRKQAPEIVRYTMHALEVADLMKGSNPR
jgi:hypothetical protein